MREKMWKSMEIHSELKALLPNTGYSLRNVFFYFQMCYRMVQEQPEKICGFPERKSMRANVSPHFSALTWQEFCIYNLFINFSPQVPPSPFSWQISSQTDHRDTKLARHLCPVLSKQPSLLIRRNFPMSIGGDYLIFIVVVVVIVFVIFIKSIILL